MVGSWRTIAFARDRVFETGLSAGTIDKRINASIAAPRDLFS
jgi:hypothetical protein